MEITIKTSISIDEKEVAEAMYDAMIDTIIYQVGWDAWDSLKDSKKIKKAMLDILPNACEIITENYLSD